MDTVQQPVDASDRNERDPNLAPIYCVQEKFQAKKTERVQAGFKSTEVMIVIIQESKDLSPSPRA